MPKKLPTEIKTVLVRVLKDNNEHDELEVELVENLASTDVTQPPSLTLQD